MYPETQWDGRVIMRSEPPGVAVIDLRSKDQPKGDLMQTHKHPRSAATIEGTRLSSGQLIEEGDFYSQSDGQWAPVIPGQIGQPVHPDSAVIYVRPTKVVSTT